MRDERCPRLAQTFDRILPQHSFDELRRHRGWWGQQHLLQCHRRFDRYVERSIAQRILRGCKRLIRDPAHVNIVQKSPGAFVYTDERQVALIFYHAARRRLGSRAIPRRR